MRTPPFICLLEGYSVMGYDEQVQFYNLLVNAGCEVIPRLKDSKLPHPDWWSKDRKPIADALTYQAAQTVEGWCVKTGNIFVLDIDPHSLEQPLEETLEFLQKLSPTKFIIATPSGGYHLYYKVPEGVYLTNKTPPLKGVDARGHGGYVVSLGSKITYGANNKGLPVGFTGEYKTVEYGEYTTIPYLTKNLLNWLETKKLEVDARKNVNSRIVAKHYEHSIEEREHVVLECLSYILKDWGVREYEQWLQMWMSAYDGANTDTVRDYIYNHEGVYWADGEKGKQKFLKDWENHKPREGGYTVASLFWLAKKAGWLVRTNHEIPEDRVIHLNTRYISDAALEGNRVILISQTGTGKTRNIVNLWHKLNKPKTVIFVPTTKLAIELHSTLVQQGIPAVLYYDTVAKKPKPKVDLIAADFLVTTLQSFATKVDTSMSEYGLVYIEESDQLLSAFSRGGGGLYSSQVREKEARKGFKVLQDALLNSGTVWAVDATATMLTVTLFDEICIQPVTIYKNDYVLPKANVIFLEDKHQALQAAIDYAAQGKRVAVVCDTARQAAMAHYILTDYGFDSLLVIKDTEHNPEVISFLQDVNSLKHQIICYNSVMGSGVSIDKIHVDVVVQFCGYLSPRSNLQLLNRFRSQGVVYCYYTHRENYYVPTVEDLEKFFDLRLKSESVVLGIDSRPRTTLAELRTKMASISVSDVGQQKRNPKIFYTRLLELDGRKIMGDEVLVSEGLLIKIKNAIERNKELREWVRHTWHEYPPLTVDDVVPPKITEGELACRLAHGRILQTMPYLPKIFDSAEVYDVYEMFLSVGVYMKALLPEDASYLAKAAATILDVDKSKASITPLSSYRELLRGVSLIFEDLATPVSGNKVPVTTFLAWIEANKDIYDAVMPRYEDKFKHVYNPQEPLSTVMRFSKNILKVFGLKQRAKSWGNTLRYYIANYKEACLYAKWRYNSDKLVLPKNEVKLRINREMFAKATNRQKDLFIELLTKGYSVEDAMHIAIFSTNKGLI